MIKISFYACIAAAFIWAFPGIPFSLETDPVAQQIFRMIQTGQKTNAFTCRKERICGISAIPSFYRKLEYAPVWTREGNPTHALRDLVKALELSYLEGLSPDIYHFSEIQRILKDLEALGLSRGAVTPLTLAELDILLSDAFLLYATHLRAGRVDPETIHTAWVAFLPEIDLGNVLSEALETGRIAESLAALTPSDEGYRRLKEALATYREIARSTSWPQIPSGGALRLGEENVRVHILRQALKAWGDLDDREDGRSSFFDESLDLALHRFQRRHGLQVDGVLGPKTLNALNRSMKERIRQIELNLERWRWLPHDLGDRHLLVNIAAFRLDVMEAGRSVLDMRVVVGTDYRKSPVFSETLKYIVINPYWNVPFRIAVKDKLPLIQKDPSYLSKNGYRIFTGWEDNAEEVTPESIDWSGVNRNNFVYRLRQEPGPQNALGRIKFMFPNRFSVYLHDTPQQELFGRTVRTFSSGCIRVEKPVDLAVYVLQEAPGWSREQIETAVASGKNRVVVLKNPIPVHLLYWTAWVESDGTLHFREDVYERDLLLDRALKEGPLKPGFPVSGAYQ